LRSTLWQLFYFAEAILLWSAARRQDVQHLHAHLTNVAADICWLAVVFANGGEKDGVWRWSMTVHGPTEFSAVDQFNLARKVDAADLVVCISDYCRSQLMAISPPAAWQKLVVVHCGVDLARYPYRPPHVGAGPLRVLAVGRLVPEKGQALLIEAVASLVEAGLPITVTLVGGGDEAEALTAQATQLDPDAHWHRFTGPLGQDELPSVFAAHDVFCLPSFAEGVPVVFMEAMSTGLPVVATRIAGIPELVEDGHTGILVPPGRADVIADALRALAESPDLVADLSTNGRRQVELGFDTDVLARDLVAHFASLEHASRRHHPQR
jgi:colanic acid/amylovoran biosynthesis glycosyltransferase